VFRLDRDGVVARLRARAEALVKADAAVREVRLFGSLARTEAHPGSDADLFIVVRDGAPRFLDRIADLSRHFRGVGIGCDVIAYTESERNALAARRDAFARAVLDEAIVLAAAPHAKSQSAERPAL
jgi:predicted nucleotidyltransferase